MATAAKSVLCFFLASFISAATQLHPAAQAQQVKGASSSRPCQGNAQALAALQPQDPDGVSITRIPTVGYGFYFANAALSPVIGGPNVTRGLVILPEHDVAAEAYAPYALEVAKTGRYATIVEKATAGHVLRAMMEQPLLQYWSLAGHGKGGELAAEIAVTIHPKVKSLVLLGASLPGNVDLRAINIALTVLYTTADQLIPPASIVESFTRMPGDTNVFSPFDGLGHYDLVYSTRSGNVPNSSFNSTSAMTQTQAELVTNAFVTSLALAHYAAATERALSYGDNAKLKPGRNNSKPYPSKIRVSFSEIPQPDHTPQRKWWVFTPSIIKGGFIYYPGACVDGRAYFPLAFQIAARGHLVVILQQPWRGVGAITTSFIDADAIINSKNPAFSGVKKNKWAIGGHSNGGFQASFYAKFHGGKIYALVMHAGGFAANLTTSMIPVAQIYGTLDDISPGGYDRYRYLYVDSPPQGFGPLVNLKVTKFIPINGANHFQVGDYGYQYPDDIAIISIDDQQKIFAQKTVAFLDAHCCQSDGTESGIRDISHEVLT